jgi:hypothetical protein
MSKPSSTNYPYAFKNEDTFKVFDKVLLSISSCRYSRRDIKIVLKHYDHAVGMVKEFMVIIAPGSTFSHSEQRS